MVAVALSAEVRPLPMPMEPEAAVGQVGGTATTPGTSTGIESVDDHIARLKANARQHVDREMLAAGSEASVRAAKTPYLPSKEVAKTIKCRFFPNCYYADKCMFFHPSSLENAIPYSAAAPTFDTHVNGNSSSNGPSSMNGHSNGHAASPSQLNGDIPLSPNGTAHPGSEEFGNGFDMAYNAQQPQNGQQGYYIPTGYENQAEYNPYASQMFPPQHQQHSHSQSNGQQQQASNPQANQYYGFVPYGPHGAYAYPTGQPQYPYYPQQNGGYPMYMPQAMQSHDEQLNGGHASPINGVVSPSSSSTAIPDPAIVAQGPESQDSAPAITNGAEASTSGSASMEKSSSAQSGKSTTSSKSKKAKKVADQSTTNGVNGASSPSNGLAEALSANGEFVPMPYYPVGVPMNLPGMPSEMMMMPPLPHMLQHQQGGPHFQPQAYGSFSPMNGQNAQLEADFSNKASISGDKNEKKQMTNGTHERTPSSSAPNGQMHTFFQTSGEGAPSASRAPPASANGARTAPTSASAIGGATTARFNPASSTNGPKRFPPSSYATNGVLLPRSGPVSGPNSIRRIPYDSNKPTLPCRYFETRSCRHGDLCYYTHLLIEERVIPNHSEGKLTRDARLLGLNIGSPDGRISDVLPRNPTDFNTSNGPSRRPPVLNGAQQQQNGQQQQNNAPNGFGMPQVNAKGRFVHPQQPNTQAFAAQQQQQQAQQPPQQQQSQQQKEQQIVALVNNNSADAQEKIQRLISETRNLSSSMPPPASNASGPRPNNGAAPRANGIPPTLGRRPPPAANNNRNGALNTQTNSTASHTTRQQRVPSGENDFPALAASTSPSIPTNARTNSMERSTSASSSADKKVESPANKVATSTAPATSAATAEGKKEETPKTEVATPASAAASTPNATPASAPAPTAAAAPAKPVTFSWASAAAKAASLPTPPLKRPVSKQRPASNKEKEGKGEKGEKGSKAEKGNKDTAGKNETKNDAKNEAKNEAKQVATAASTPASAATAAPVSASAPAEPAASAAQAVTSESAAAPVVKA